MRVVAPPRAVACKTTDQALEVAPESPLLAYLARLSTPASRRSALCALRALARLLGYEEPTGVPWHQLSAAHTSALRSALAERCAPATANHRLAALRGVLRAAWRLGLLDHEGYQRAVDLPPVRGRALPQGRALTHHELKALFEAAASDPRPAMAARDAALLALACGLGLRRSELVGLDLADVNLDAGTVVVRGKGGCERLGHLHDGAQDAVASWMEVRGDAAGPLLLAIDQVGRVRAGRPSATTVNRILRRLADRAGVESFTPHDLRRTFITGLLESGQDLVLVQQLAGHASPGTTSRYDRRIEEARRRAAAALHVPYAARGRG
jgi:integrase